MYANKSAKYDGNDDEHPNMSGLLVALHKLIFIKMKLKKQPRISRGCFALQGGAMTSNNSNTALAIAVRQTCATLGRRVPEVVVAVLPKDGGYVLRGASFPGIDGIGEVRVPKGQVASGVASLVGSKDALVFVHGVNPTKNNSPQSWWSFFNPINEAEEVIAGGKVCYVPLITD